jgi:hypothetical protein
MVEKRLFRPRVRLVLATAANAGTRVDLVKGSCTHERGRDRLTNFWFLCDCEAQFFDVCIACGCCLLVERHRTPSHGNLLCLLENPFIIAQMLLCERISDTILISFAE